MHLKAQAIGRLGQKPKAVTTKGGTEFVVVSLATTAYRGKERGNKTTWVDVTIFNETRCKFVLDYAKKGQLMFVEGEPSARAYEAKDGSPKATLSITVGRFDGDVKLLSGKDEGENDDSEEPRTETKKGGSKPPFDEGAGDEIDDIPGW